MDRMEPSIQKRGMRDGSGAGAGFSTACSGAAECVGLGLENQGARDGLGGETVAGRVTACSGAAECVVLGLEDWGARDGLGGETVAGRVTACLGTGDE